MHIMRNDSESNTRGYSRDRDGDADERRQTIGGRRRSRSRSRSPYRRGGGPKRERRDSYSQNDRMVYISNIPYDVRWMEIKDLVREKAGEVVFVEILEDRFGKSKGAAVVEFRDKESVQKCIEGLHRHQMKDRLVVAKEIRDPQAFFRKVKEDTGVDFLAPNGRLSRGSTGMGGGMRGGPAERMPSAGTYDTFGLSPVFLRQLGIEGPLCNRVFVANLAYNIQSGKVWEVFALAGKVTCVDLQLDKEGKSKGLGVIEYSHPIEAVQAISMLNNQRLYDRTITVKMDKYEKPVEKMPGELPRGLQGVGMGLGANGAPLTDIASVISSVSTPTGPGPLPSGPSGGGGFGGYGAGPTSGFGFGGGGGGGGVGGGGAGAGVNVGVGQGAYATAPSGPQGAYASAPSGPQGGYGGSVGGPAPAYGTSSGPQGGYGGSIGYGANGPMQGGGYSSGSAFGSQPSAGGSSGGYGGGYQSTGGSMDGGGYGRMGGMGGDFGDRGGIPISHSPTRAIIINNLPPDYTWQIVRDRTRQYGDVEFVDIVTPGSCKVRFKNIADAERARGALQGTTVEGRVIAVDFLFD